MAPCLLRRRALTERHSSGHNGDAGLVRHGDDLLVETGDRGQAVEAGQQLVVTDLVPAVVGMRLQAQRDEAEFMATHDVLTGLPNRAYLHTRMQQTLARANGKSHVRNLEPEDLAALTIEAAAMARRGGRLYMFYAGSYNNAPQQVESATSTVSASSEAEPARNLTEDQQEQYREYCQNLRKNLELLTQPKRVYVGTEDGGRHYLSDEEREEKIRSTNEKISKHCQEK